MDETQTFDRVGEQFVGYYDTVRGHVREVVTRHNLQPYLPIKLGGTAIDVGGGDGRDAEWLANMGFEVTLVDPSEEMLDKAQRRFVDNGLTANILQGSTENLPADVQKGAYDVVLSHGVVMYCLDNPKAHVRTLAELAKPKGWISILTKGYDGAVSRAMQKDQSNDLVELVKKRRVRNNLGVETWAFQPHDVIMMIQEAGLRLQDWYGVRVSSDYDKRSVEKVPDQELATILNVERTQARQPSTKGMGQMLHYIARA
jgi:2-polyprenyl-3-methyl-5-hydroxy-6-metoxy-1,4-benzoquinol methylase